VFLISTQHNNEDSDGNDDDIYGDEADNKNWDDIF
jgi:hypothetical protein